MLLQEVFFHTIFFYLKFTSMILDFLSFSKWTLSFNTSDVTTSRGGWKIYSRKCIKILLLHPIYHSAISWVAFLKINFILWPVPSGSANMGIGFELNCTCDFMDHVFNYLRTLRGEWERERETEREHAPPTTLFTGTRGMEKWDLMSYVQQQEGNGVQAEQTMSGCLLTARCLLWQIWTEVSINTWITWQTLPTLSRHTLLIYWLLLPIWL